MIRDDIKAATIAAMKGGDKPGTQTLRMVQSAIKNRDIELRTSATTPDDDAKAAIGAIVAELGATSMKDMGPVMALVKQRHASAIEPSRASGLVRQALS